MEEEESKGRDEEEQSGPCLSHLTGWPGRSRSARAGDKISGHGTKWGAGSRELRPDWKEHFENLEVGC